MGIAGNLAKAFIRSKLTPVLILVSIALGVFSVLTTPKEEEPQIVVPMIDILISYPGATPEEVERRVVTPLEKKLWELKDIEYIYSASMDGMAIVTARFYVGTDPTKALVDLNTKMMSAMDLAPPGVSLPPLIKPKSIDDVPILTLTVWGKEYDWYELRRIANSIENEIKKVNNVADVFIVGGRPRQMKIILDPVKLSAYKLSVLHIANAIRSANSELSSGKITQNDYELTIRTGEFLKSKSDVENLLVAVVNSKPVFIKDVAKVEDGPADISNYVFMGLGPHHGESGFNQGEVYPAVTIAVAKRVGTNAVNVAKEVLSTLEHIQKTQLPNDIKITVTRNYGETAEEKANTLIKKLLIATFSVILLIAVALGVREAIVVGIAVPVTLAIALFLSQMFGFTLNRVTLFALIFAIGILVDDAIVVVENIHRWFELKLAKTSEEAIIKATDEVGNPTILATFTVIAALMPMAFVTGLMGPYMRPIPINASVAMFFSLLVAFIITPWASYILLREQFHKREQEKDPRGGAYWKFYTSIMAPMLSSNLKRYLFYGFNIALLVLSIGLLVSKAIIVKMLPYDNKSEVQVVLDMPEGTSLERTLEVAKEIASVISKQSLVSNYQVYVGTSSPFNFNGLVRHYYLRQSSNLADIQINLIHKDKRKEQSHDFAKKLRPLVREIALKHGAKYIAVVEVPPGPPVLSPIVAEVYAPELKTQESIAREVLKIFRKSESITDEGIYLEEPSKLVNVVINQEKLAKAGISKEEAVLTLQALFGGRQIGIIQNTDTEHTPIVVKVDERL
ncbi:MAG: efflux RND transporter permease subunit, partial [Aquificaceae bacterium]|nr:efflux RND transporter permease subunit [Aquificaceae bacterium]MDW8237675.1 efflux RND transporter permease subunit [Aquificaceae bacterium]